MNTSLLIAPADIDRESVRQRPRERPVMYQSWRSLLFLHWRYDPELLQRLLPPGLTVDLHEGAAYVAVTPFFMRRVRPAGLPAVPGLSDFLELNVRTYVIDARGVPGVWFFSLDCNQPLAVALARKFYFLPYHRAEMTAAATGAGFRYICRRRGQTTRTELRYQPSGPAFAAQPGSLEFFLVERYVLFSFHPRKRRLYSARVHHAPYSLTQAEVVRYDETMFSVDRLDRPGHPPDHVMMSSGVDVEIFRIRPAGSG